MLLIRIRLLDLKPTNRTKQSKLRIETKLKSNQTQTKQTKQSIKITIKTHYNAGKIKSKKEKIMEKKREIKKNGGNVKKAYPTDEASRTPESRGPKPIQVICRPVSSEKERESIYSPPWVDVSILLHC